MEDEFFNQIQQETANAPILSVTINDWEAYDQDSKQEIVDSEEKKLINDRINFQIQNATLKHTVLPNYWIMNIPMNGNTWKKCNVVFKHNGAYTQTLRELFMQ